MDQEVNTLQVVFKTIMAVPFGKAVYLIGNTFDLGEWEITKAIRLKYYPQNNWVTKVRMPIGTKLEYKYFVSDY